MAVGFEEPTVETSNAGCVPPLDYIQTVRFYNLYFIITWANYELSHFVLVESFEICRKGHVINTSKCHVINGNC